MSNVVLLGFATGEQLRELWLLKVMTFKGDEDEMTKAFDYLHSW